MMDWVLSIVVLAAAVLIAGAFMLYRRGVRRQAWLMVLLAVIMLANVAIWALPVAGDRPLLDAPAEGEARSPSPKSG